MPNEFEFAIDAAPVFHNESGQYFVALSFGVAGGIMTSTVMIPYKDWDSTAQFCDTLSKNIMGAAEECRKATFGVK